MKTIVVLILTALAAGTVAAMACPSQKLHRFSEGMPQL
jgi:hypothetical protein